MTVPYRRPGCVCHAAPKRCWWCEISPHTADGQETIDWQARLLPDGRVDCPYHGAVCCHSAGVSTRPYGTPAPQVDQDTPNGVPLGAHHPHIDPVPEWNKVSPSGAEVFDFLKPRRREVFDFLKPRQTIPQSDSPPDGDMGAAAVEYARNGWEVFPLLGKVPAIKGGRGVLDATSDVDQVIAWWSGPYRGCNIGIRVPETMFLLDVDGPDRRPRPGKGLEALAQMEAENEPLPETLTQITGSGGLHMLFRRPPGGLSKAGLPAGLEFKDRGGYFVGAPGIHPDTGESYVWVDRPVAAPPQYLIEMIVERPKPKPAAPIRPRRATIWDTPGSSPADRFTASTSWGDILQPHGWECVDTDPDADGCRWRHPTATSKCSATIKNGCLFVYSPNTPFDITEASNPKGYSKFRAHSVLNHGGDMKAAAAAIIKDKP